MEKENEQFRQRFAVCRPVFTAMGDPNRQLILKLLMEHCGQGGMRVGEIQKGTNISRTAVSHHMKVLMEAGMVSCKKEGTKNFYFLDTKSHAMKETVAFWRQVQERMDRCPMQQKGETT